VDWLEYPISTPHKVLYVDEEQPTNELRRRFKNLDKGRPIAKDAYERLWTISGTGLIAGPQGGNVPDLIKRLVEAKFKPDVIIFETIRRIFRGNSDKADDVVLFWREFNRLWLDGACTLIFDHHMTKDRGEDTPQPSERAAGSGDWIGGGDASLALLTTKNGLELHCVKQRLGPGFYNRPVCFFDECVGQYDAVRFVQTHGRPSSKIGPVPPPLPGPVSDEARQVPVRASEGRLHGLEAFGPGDRE
jgi:hypothetical protein